MEILRKRTEITDISITNRIQEKEDKVSFIEDKREEMNIP